MTSDDRWIPDVLGGGFQQRTLLLGDDDEGELVATLVRLLPDERPWWRLPHERPVFGDVDVLYVHGWSDYFFQTRLARFWADRGARFFALDLRKYGRSLRPGQTPGFVGDLTVYDEDIAAARAAMGTQAAGRRLVLLGHSTGGLTLSLWAARHPDAVTGVILNSPWLALQLPALTRAAVTPLIQLSARLNPLEVGPQLDLGFYARAQQAVADPDDPMTVDLAWRPEHTMPVHAGWLHAVVAGQNRVHAGLGIAVPVCVLLSQRFVMPTRWSDDLTNADTVLVVDDIAREALKLGSSVTVERLDGALHDVFLSRAPVRAEAYRRMDRWARGMLGRR